jgi:hypothetical protein
MSDRMGQVMVVVVCAASVAAGLSYAQSGSPTSSGQLVLLDGSAVAYQSLEIRAEKVSGRGVPDGIALDDLRRIEPSGGAAAATETPAAVVELRGGRVLAKQLTIANEKCRIEWSGGQPMSLAVDLVRGIRFDGAAVNADFEKALAAPSAELDRVFIKDADGKVNGVTGLVDALDASQLTIEVSGQNRQLPREKVVGIVVAQPAVADATPRCEVTFRDGSVLGGLSLELAGGEAKLSLAGGGQVEFTWSAASRVAIRSSRVAYLSDLKAIVEEQRPIVTLPLPAQRDKSVSGKALMLGSRTYEKGLGVHSRSLLTFAAEKKWDTLAATIGLDAAAGGKGDCEFVVLADGEPLFKRRMKASEESADIQLAITGREQVTLLVEPGAGLDLADHANWCDVRFVRGQGPGARGQGPGARGQ